MLSNDILRSLRYTLQKNEPDLVKIWNQVDFEIKPWEVNSFLKSELEEGFIQCPDIVLDAFLNGLVVEKRGKSDKHPTPEPLSRIDNNIVLKKLRVAFALRDSDVASLLRLAGFRISKTELSAFFRSPKHQNYRECKDQLLRNFLKGLAKQETGD